MKTKIAAYEKILKLVTEEISEDRIELSQSELESTITKLKVSEEFGIPVDIKASYPHWLQIKNHWDKYMTIGLYGEEHGRTISWSDDSRQPENEWLLVISFPCGAYTFGGEGFDAKYPKKTFDAFFDELKSYSPLYSDTANHSLYFASDVAKVVYENFYDIFNKYKSQVGEELKAQRKEKLLKELEQLTND